MHDPGSDVILGVIDITGGRAVDMPQTIAMVREDGYFWITGRVDDVINVSGHRLSTAEIESALVSHPAVAEAAVIAAADDLTGPGGGGVRRPGRWHRTRRGPGDQAARAHRQAGPAQPDHLGRRPAKTRSGKIMRRLLRDVAENREPGDVTTLRDPSVLAQLQRNART